MITVAKNIDAPIKLVFTSAKGASMLGLGDIVVPGILMALALRFDQYMYYKRQGKLKTIWIERGTHLISRQIRIKARYVDPRGQWGNRFWTTPSGLFFFFYAPVPEAEEPAAATAFPKPYFYASVWGYTVGMFATLTAMLVFNHGQPALLYLVPCVTGALWLTGLWRGEFWDMWEYTEDGSLDTEDLIVEVDTEGKVIEEDEGEKEDEEKDPEPRKPSDGFHELFLFSVTAPRAVASVS
jgi:minor histocompatibility antigen H13